jgi:hypothetical protein
MRIILELLDMLNMGMAVMFLERTSGTSVPARAKKPEPTSKTGVSGP